MKLKWKALQKFVMLHKWSVGVGAVAVLALIFLSAGNGAGQETAELKRADLVRTVKISGKVTPESKVDLGFEISGTVALVSRDVGERVERGDILVQLDSSSLSADVLKAEAELASAEAELGKLSGDARESYENSLSNAERVLAQTVRDAYTASTDAIYNKSDRFFQNARTAYPNIIGIFKESNGLRDGVNKSRPIIGQVLLDWGKIIGGPSSVYSSADVSKSKEYLAQVSSFVNNVANIVNLFEVDSTMIQSEIDSHKNSMATAQSSLNTTIQNLIAAEKTYSNLLADVPVQSAKVSAARANLLNLISKSDKGLLVSPISGVVSKQEAKVGQAVTVGSALTSIISDGYLIEVFIPEVSIGEVEVGKRARVTLDAYGEDEVFDAVVVSLDPAETLRDGVSTYKVELSFSEPSRRILSGMTANVEIETVRRSGVALLPERAVVREGEGALVYSLSGKEIPVVVGERDSSGNIEILGGLQEGEQVLINPPIE